MKKEQASMVLYLYLHSKVGEPVLNKRNRERIMTIEEVYWRMFQWRIPKCIKPIIVKIWEDMGIIKKVGRNNIQFIKTDFDIENMGKIYKDLGIF